MAKAKKGKLTIEDVLVPLEEQPYQIPENWCWTRIDSVANVYTGNSINERVKAEKYEGQKCGLLFIATKDVDFDNSINYETNVRITDPENFKKAPVNTALLCIEGGSAGRKIGFTNQEVCFGNKLCAFASDKIEPKYIYYFLQSNAFIYQFNDKKHGLIGGVSVKDLCEIGIALPPLEEQKRIVKQIENWFTKLDMAKDKLHDVMEAVLGNKQALLFKAFEGLLTEKWRHDNGYDDTWESLSLIDVLVEKPRNGYSPKPVDYQTQYKSMTLSATTSGVFKPEFYKYIDEKIADDSYLWLKQGDILIQRANSLEKVGTSAIYTGGEHEFIYPDLIMKLQVKDGISPEFICYQLKTEKTMEYFRSNATGTAGNMPKINQKVVSNVEIVLPSINEQEEIVSILNRMYECYDAIIEGTQLTVSKIEELKKSILAKAFSGELGTNISDEESSVELLKEFVSVV